MKKDKDITNSPNMNSNGNENGASSNSESSTRFFSRRSFLQSIGLGVATLGFSKMGCTSNEQSNGDQIIPGFEESEEENPSKGWEPVSDRKIRVGIVGYGLSKFGARFGFQNHPNVEVTAVSDLFPDRRAALAEATGCDKTYPSLEELIKDDSIEAVFVATDAPSHADHCIKVLESGKHVAVAVPAVFGSLEDADRLYEVVKKNRGLKYMMFETSCYRANLYAMRQLYQNDILGDIVYAEGEYYHPQSFGSEGNPKQYGSYKDWRMGLPPQWYPTHSDAYYVGVTDGSFTEVSCLGVPSPWDPGPEENKYGNPYSTEISMYRTNDDGIARMARSDTLGFHAETGRVRGLKGSYYGKYEGPESEENLPDLSRPAIPPNVPPGGHGGSHGRLTNEFIESILEDRRPLVDVANALNMTVGGIVAHKSALNGGEWMKVPQYSHLTE